MSTIRTATLGAGVTGTGGGTFVLYTCPTGYHVKVNRVMLEVTTAAGRVQYVVVRSGVANVQVLDETPAAVPNLLKDAGGHVLEAGDVIALIVAAGTNVEWWASGTVYEN